MKVRTTMQPDVELDVDEAEYLDLQRQGVLLDDDNTTPANQAPQTETAHSVAPKPAVKEK